MGGGGQPYSIKSNSNTISQIPINNTISNPITNNTESLDSKRISESKSKNSNIDSTESKDFKDSIKAIESKLDSKSVDCHILQDKACNNDKHNSTKSCKTMLNCSFSSNDDKIESHQLQNLEFTQDSKTHSKSSNLESPTFSESSISDSFSISETNFPIITSQALQSTNNNTTESKQTLESNPKTPKELKDFNINSNIDSTESKDFKDSIKAIESKQMLESNKSNLRDSKDCNKAYTDSIKYLESNLTDSNKYNADTNPKDSKPSILSQDSILFKPIDTLTQELFDTNSCKYLPKLYAIYKSTKDIDFDKLPNSFVLKTNHDCGGVVLVPDKEAFLKDSKTFTESMDKLTKHLNTNFYTMYREWHYKDIEPRIFAEEMLEEQRNGEWEVPENYRMFCFQDNIFIQVDDANYADTHKRWFYNQEWVFQDFSYNMPILSDIIAMPQMLCDMKQIANHLTKQIGFVRVDLYILQCRVIVGELTFTPVGGTGKFTPKEWDKKLGDLWMLE